MRDFGVTRSWKEGTTESHMQTLIIYKLGFNQNYYTFTLILLIKIVLCSKFPSTKFINYKCFEMKSSPPLADAEYLYLVASIFFVYLSHFRPSI